MSAFDLTKRHLAQNLHDATIDLAAKVAFLTELPGVDTVIETHMSFVFLSQTHAFKLKKPVKFPNFDHRTLPLRKAACDAELRLNRDLAGDVYIGLLPVKQVAGRLALSGEGHVVDWLICMKRLPAHMMLDTRIAAGLAGTGPGPSLRELGSVAKALCSFYQARRPRRPQRGLYFDHLTTEQNVNLQDLVEMSGHLGTQAPASLLADLTERVAASRDEIAAREDEHLIVEGHGDLRPEHVCLVTPPVIFDRVETGLNMRVIDIFDEVGNLATECALLGRPDLRAALFEPLVNAGFVLPSQRLMTTYSMFRLVTHARLSLVHLRDADCKVPAKWITRANRYLAAASQISETTPANRHA